MKKKKKAVKVDSRLEIAVFIIDMIMLAVKLIEYFLLIFS